MTSAPFTTEPDNDRSPWVERMVVLLFLVGITTPLCVQAFGTSDDEVILEREQRLPTPMPKVPTNLTSWTRFPRATDDWYAERFGLRNELLYAYQWTKIKMLHEAPNDENVFGPNDWIFGNGRGGLHSNRGASPFNPEELQRWRESLVAKHEWLKSRGIDYAFVLIPGKPSIYPEELPPALRPVAESRHAQFVEEMRKSPEVNFIDLYPELFAARATDSETNHLWFPLGLHWTQRGALVAYRTLMQRLPERHQGRELLDFHDFRLRPGGRGDDFSRNYLVDGLFAQNEDMMMQIPANPARRARTKPDDPSCWFQTFRNKDRSLTKALILRDSFGSMIAPFLAQQFSELVQISTHYFSPAVIEACNPELVIELYANQVLTWQPPHLLSVFENTELERRFEAMDRVLLPSIAAGRPPEIAGLRGAEVEETPDGVLLSSDGTQAVSLPHFTWYEGELTIVRIELTAPAKTYLALFYPQPGTNAYRMKQASHFPLEGGRQVVYMALPLQQRDDSLGLQPGCAVGDYVIHDVEARSAPE